MVLVHIAKFVEDTVKSLQEKPLLGLAGFILLYVLHAVSYHSNLPLLVHPSDFLVVFLCVHIVSREAYPRPLVGSGIENTSHACYI